MVLLLVGLVLFHSMKFARKMTALARTDELTGLFNRRAILEHGENELQRARRFNRPFSCLMLDIDHFKDINDTLDHDTGDFVLREVTRVVKQTLRGTDLIGRVGGEEFLLLSSETETDKAELLAQRLRKNVAGTRLEALNGKQVTVSIGVAEYESEESLEVQVKHVDQALYRAKSAGRNQVMVFEA